MASEYELRQRIEQADRNFRQGLYVDLLKMSNTVPEAAFRAYRADCAALLRLIRTKKA